MKLSHFLKQSILFSFLASLLSCTSGPEETSKPSYFSATGLRRVATPEEMKPVLFVETGCTGFFIKNDKGLPLVGSARHCFEYSGGFEKWCADAGKVYDSDGAEATCKEVVAASPDLDAVIFEVRYPKPVEAAFSIATYLPAPGTPLNLIGYPADYIRNQKPTLSYNCEVLPHDPEVFQPSIIAQTADRSLGHDCTTWGGNSGGPMIVEGTEDVIALPGSYTQDVRIQDAEVSESSIWPKGQMAELNLLETLVSRYKEKLVEKGVVFTTVQTTLPRAEIAREPTKAELMFSDLCERSPDDYSHFKKLTKTESCIEAAKKLSSTTELPLPHAGIKDLSFLQTGLFDKNLRALYLQDNKLKSIEGIKRLSNLVLLDLSNYNGGENEIDSIAELTESKLKVLYLGSTGFKKLDQIAEMTDLNSLELNNNGIESLEKLRGASSNISYLNISSNKLKSLSGIQNIRYITELFASNNELTDISQISVLRQLNLAYLNSNKITSSDLSKLRASEFSNLQFLDISSNNLTGPVSFISWPALSYLYLENNKIEELVVIDNTKLYQLNADKNLIHRVLFDSNPSLQYVTLSNNELKSLHGLNTSGIASFTSRIDLMFNFDLSDLGGLADVPWIHNLWLVGTGWQSEEEVKALLKENVGSIAI